MGPKCYACVAMSHDHKFLCRMIRMSKLRPSHVKWGVSPLILPPCRHVHRFDFYPCSLYPFKGLQNQAPDI